MRRATALSFLSVVALSVSVSEAGPLTATFSAARRAGGTTAAWSSGPLSYEVEVTNSKSSALRTNVIVEVPITPTTKKVMATIPVNIAGNSKQFVAFTHTDGFNVGGCKPMLFYVKLENAAAAPVTVQSAPTCSFTVGSIKKESVDLLLGKPGYLWAHSQVVKPVTCASGVSVTTTLRNQSLGSKTTTVAVGDSMYVAKSPAVTVAPGQSVTTTAATGPHPKFWGAEVGPWSMKLEPAAGGVKQPVFSFNLSRSCRPVVSLLQGTVPFSY